MVFLCVHTPLTQLDFPLYSLLSCCSEWGVVQKGLCVSSQPERECWTNSRWFIKLRRRNAMKQSYLYLTFHRAVHVLLITSPDTQGYPNSCQQALMGNSRGDSPSIFREISNSLILLALEWKDAKCYLIVLFLRFKLRKVKGFTNTTCTLTYLACTLSEATMFLGRKQWLRRSTSLYDRVQVDGCRPRSHSVEKH